MDKKKQKIKFVTFDHRTNQVILNFKKELPSSGYGAKELVDFLNKFGLPKQEPDPVKESFNELLQSKENQSQTANYRWNWTTSQLESQPVPHRCPICNGSGIVPPGFYNSTSGFSTSNVASEPCRQCSGTGIIWSK